MLPKGAKWFCDKIKIAGDQFSTENRPLIEEVELWRRDIIDVIRDLIGNPAFLNHICYAPVHAFTDDSAKSRIYDEMWTGDWW